MSKSPRNHNGAPVPEDPLPAKLHPTGQVIVRRIEHPDTNNFEGDFFFFSAGTAEQMAKLRKKDPVARWETIVRKTKLFPDKIPHRDMVGKYFQLDTESIWKQFEGIPLEEMTRKGGTIEQVVERSHSSLSAKTCSKCGMPEPGWTEGEAPDNSMELSGCKVCGKSYWKVPSSATRPKGADWLDPAKHPPVEPVTVGGPTGDLKPEVARKTYPPSNPRHPEHQIWLEQEAKRRKKSVAVLKAAEEMRRKEQTAKKEGK